MKKIKSLSEILSLMSKSSRVDAVYDLVGKVEIPRRYLDEAINVCNREGNPESAIYIAQKGGLQDVADEIYQRRMKQYERQRDSYHAADLAKAYGRPEDAVNIHVRRKDYTRASLAARHVGLDELANKYFNMSPVSKRVEKILKGKKRKQ